MDYDYYFVFDVECDGLMGPAFALGYVLLNRDGVELESNYFRSKHEVKDAWVAENIEPLLPKPNCTSLSELQEAFWSAWTRWRDRGAVLVADCPFPVETNFLASCVLRKASQQGIDPIEISPYPVIDVSSVLFAKGKDPLAKHNRLPNELPAHDPVKDSRQSGRLLIENLC